LPRGTALGRVFSPQFAENDMQTDNRLLDDLAKLAAGALGALHGLKTEIEQIARLAVERLLADMNLVRRDEFDAVKAMAVEARKENERLARNLAALSKTPRKPAARRPRRKHPES
jgi:BMFP domain-containing protein YqiC